jgi:hypothetical protein
MLRKVKTPTGLASAPALLGFFTCSSVWTVSHYSCSSKWGYWPDGSIAPSILCIDALVGHSSLRFTGLEH